jgi:glycosyltransferase involved in cell wall biosynthesis
VFVTAFNRDRDHYQVALALHEQGLLHKLVTDLYLPDGLRGSYLAGRLGVGHRYCKGLPSKYVEPCLPALYRQVLGLPLQRTNGGILSVFRSVDKALSQQSLRTARRGGAGFFTYSGYSLEAFTSAYAKNRPKILFVYHPPAHGFTDALRADLEKHPEIAWSYDLHMTEARQLDEDRILQEILLADHIVCASAFTASAVRDLRPTAAVTIVPYGCSNSPGRISKPSADSGVPKVLFVGQGVQRKGLHHLLKVWSSRKDWGAQLSLVCSSFDPGLKPIIDASPSPIQVESNLPAGELQRKFQDADIFVMPSLAEGFGLVYLEALAAGCFVIGTASTGLPDLFADGEMAIILEAGNLHQIEQAILDAIKMVKGHEINPINISEKALMANSWSEFRAGIKRVALQFGSQNC